MVQLAPELVILLNRALEDLSRIREQAQGEHALAYKAYEASAKELVRRVLSEIKGIIIHIEDTLDVDVWVRLVGIPFADGTAPTGVLGRYLQRLTVANQHAVGLLERVTRGRKRFSQYIKTISEFDVVATGSGSLTLGLRSPRFDRLVNSFSALSQATFWHDDVLKKIEEAEALRKRSLDGLRLLLRVMKIADDDSELEIIESEAGGRKGLLSLMHYAKDLTPSSRNEMEKVLFFGRALEVPEENPFVATLDTRFRLLAATKKLEGNSRYITGHGIVRELDLDRVTFHMRPFQFEDKLLTELRCRLPDDFPEERFEQLLNKSATVQGFLVLSALHEPRYLEIESIVLHDDRDT